jgi:hypothetical protein
MQKNKLGMNLIGLGTDLMRGCVFAVSETSEETEVVIKAPVKNELLPEVQLDGQVTVHCSILGSFLSDRIRIWESTYLFPKESGHKSELASVHNITLYPHWTKLQWNERHYFTLVFTGLPRDCKEFDLVEVVSAGIPFQYRNIQRNETDVYRINF